MSSRLMSNRSKRASASPVASIRSRLPLLFLSLRMTCTGQFSILRLRALGKFLWPTNVAVSSNTWAPEAWSKWWWL